MNGFGKMSLIAAMVALAPVVAMAGNAARDAILQGYAEEAVAEDPAFAGFSAERGQSLYMGPHQGGNPETNACAACHTRAPMRKENAVPWESSAGAQAVMRT